MCKSEDEKEWKNTNMNCQNKDILKKACVQKKIIAAPVVVPVEEVVAQQQQIQQPQQIQISAKKKNRLNPKTLSIPNVKNQLKPSIRTPQQNIQNKEIDIENFLGNYQNQPKTKVQRVKDAIGKVKNVLLATTRVNKMREKANNDKIEQIKTDVSNEFINEQLCMMTNQTDPMRLDEKFKICFPSMGRKRKVETNTFKTTSQKIQHVKELRASAKTDNDLFNICSGAFKTENSYRKVFQNVTMKMPWI